MHFVKSAVAGLRSGFGRPRAAAIRIHSSVADGRRCIRAAEAIEGSELFKSLLKTRFRFRVRKYLGRAAARNRPAARTHIRAENAASALPLCKIDVDAKALKSLLFHRRCGRNSRVPPDSNRSNGTATFVPSLSTKSHRFGSGLGGGSTRCGAAPFSRATGQTSGADAK